MHPKKCFLSIAILLACHIHVAAFAEVPKVGDVAPNFTLQSLAGETVQLDTLSARGDVLLIVLRGWPGYQCPLCSRQVHDFVKHADAFNAAHTQVVMIYPGPSEKLQEHAQEFLQDKSWPKDFTLLIDPDYAFTHLYDLRWNAPKETAYPSTFVLTKGRTVQFAHVSHEHGNRVSADDALKAIAAIAR